MKSFLKKWVLYFASKIVAWATEHRQLEQNKKYNLNKSISLYNVSLIGKVEIGDFTYINEGSTLSGGESSAVKIGKHCAIGRQVHITSKTHDFSLPTSDETHMVHNTMQLFNNRETFTITAKVRNCLIHCVNSLAICDYSVIIP